MIKGVVVAKLMILDHSEEIITRKKERPHTGSASWICILHGHSYM